MSKRVISRILILTIAAVMMVQTVSIQPVFAASTISASATGLVNAKSGAVLRQKSSTSSKKIMVLKDDTKVKIIREVFKKKTSIAYKNKWLYVQVGDKKGYIRSDLVDTIRYTAVAGKIKANVNYRRGPGTKMKKCGTLKKGTAVTVYLPARPVYSTRGSSLDWYKIRINKTYYYVAASKVDIVGSIFTNNTNTITADKEKAAALGASAANMTPEEFEAALTAQGFPEDYKVKLRELHKAHPNWVFLACNTGVSWKDALSKQTKDRVSLIHSSQPVSYRSKDANSYKEVILDSEPIEEQVSEMTEEAVPEEVTQESPETVEDDQTAENPSEEQVPEDAPDANVEDTTEESSEAPAEEAVTEETVDTEAAQSEQGDAEPVKIDPQAVTGSRDASEYALAETSEETSAEEAEAAEAAAEIPDEQAEVASGDVSEEADNSQEQAEAAEAPETAEPEAAAEPLSEQSEAAPVKIDPQAVSGSRDASDGYIAKEPGWYNANSQVVAYYMDPRNFLNEDRIYMFEDLSYQPAYQVISIVTKILSPTKLPGYGFTAKLFMDAGSVYDISPVFLAARARQESGGGSVTINGSKYNGKVVYNPFNIGATGSDPATNGLKYAYNHGWTTQAKAVNGAASYLASGYINKGQNSIYFQRFNVANGASNVGTHQYMTNIQAPYSEAYITKTSYASLGITQEPLAFIIPIYKDMPKKTELPG